MTEMTIDQMIEKVKTMSGYQLFKAIKWASTHNPQVFQACYERAKQLKNRHEGNWEEAKNKFQAMQFPTWKVESGYKSQTVEVDGYNCDIVQDVDDRLNVKTKNMVLMNHLTNSCIINWHVRNKEISF